MLHMESLLSKKQLKDLFEHVTPFIENAIQTAHIADVDKAPLTFLKNIQRKIAENEYEHFEAFFDDIKELRLASITCRNPHLLNCTTSLLLCAADVLHRAKQMILQLIQQHNIELILKPSELQTKRKSLETSSETSVVVPASKKAYLRARTKTTQPPPDKTSTFGVELFSEPQKKGDTSDCLVRPHAPSETLPSYNFVPPPKKHNVRTEVSTNLKRTIEMVLANESSPKRVRLSKNEHVDCSHLSNQSWRHQESNNNKNDIEESFLPRIASEASSQNSLNINTAQKLLQELHNLHYIKVNPNEVEKSDVVLGYGNFATVYKGKFRGCDVAIKCFSPKVSEEHFQSELKKMSSLRCPCLVQYMGYCPAKKWIIMEWMERGSLFNLLHGNQPIGPLSWRRKVSMAKDVACALLYLHNSNIRHCDLNSKNLLVTKEFKIKVGDLGLSEEIFDGLSQTDKRIGTLRWMSPEILKKQCKSLEKSDVYSFGIVMFELGAQVIPYYDKVDQDVRSIVHKGGRPEAPDNSIWKECPKFKKLMEQCWKANPEERPNFSIIYNILGELAEELEEQRNEKEF